MITDVDRHAGYRDEYLKIEELVVGKRYRGKGRNFDEGVWNGEGFLGMRHKFGDTFEDRELHFDADPHYGTFQPYELVEVA